MPPAFIVRPFGTKEGIDFDRVERELIDPVLDALGLEGRTTADIFRAGNIRTDMFERLLLADVVIADISIHNANVYYEIGIRHALRPRTTILIRSGAHEVPFDLSTDRYLAYDLADLDASREALTAAVTQSKVSGEADSPVFRLLPALKAIDPDTFRPVPEAFGEAVRDAAGQQDLPMLAVLGEEAQGFDWGQAGLKLVGRAQYRLNALADARATWEMVRDARDDDDDREANLMLGTIYQRLGDPAASTASIDRVMSRAERLDDEDLAEAKALLGRNAKDRWIEDWRSRADSAVGALRSPFLEEARAAYDEGYAIDQNSVYPGVNALAMTVVALRLAERLPEVWAERFEEEEEAQRELDKLKRAARELESAVRRSLRGATMRDSRDRSPGVWTDLSFADLRLLTSDRPGFVAAGYERARAKAGMDASGATFPTESAARQLRLYLELGLFTECANAALAALGAAVDPPEPPPRPRVIVFAGHRIDAPTRARPRFPPASEDAAAQMIRAAIAEEKQLAGPQQLEGIAGAASGGDILFHELCAEQAIPTRLMLALPTERFAAASVLEAGPDWMERFHTLCKRQEIKVLADSEALPAWLAARDGYTIWERNNRWILHTALSRSDIDITLIVLWDGAGGDGPGGTRDMVKLAASRGVRVVKLDAGALV